MKNAALCSAVCIAIAGCGTDLQSSNSSSEVVTPSQCVTTKTLTFSEASDDGSHQSGQGPDLAVDGNFSDESRWSSQGQGKALTLTLKNTSTLTGIDLHWLNASERTAYYDLAISSDNQEWQTLVSNGSSEGSSTSIALPASSYDQVRYLRLTGNGNSENDWNSLVELVATGCNQADEGVVIIDDLNPSLPPSDNFDLADWYLSVPTDEDNSGTSDSIKESELNNGYESQYFYTGVDGGMVFWTPIYGYKTSSNTSYVRTELREMLRRGDTSIKTQGVNKNNWVSSSAPESAQTAAGGVDGLLTATVAVNHVTTTGEEYQIGRVIIGQIHAADDEPIRLYYRKLPNNTHGAIYFAHEPVGKDDEWYEMIGSKDNDASDPADGIALNEKFTYQIQVVGNILTVTIIRDGHSNVSKSIDMSASGYATEDEYMYFKAGVYNQNKSGDSDDYVQATFYSLTNQHTGYNP
ncbi:polysaccharide lyase family 7 protein [Vibrio sp. SCSIO 43136]|uniref:polysaccharide lyase family 7 protein n=1 Tax=Vibrio sp. SCSIO 43136 TaxID=2819101 RepID=UPI002075B05A|nr:polysaccharide lyase family 7 protein [Vibrio sp. SCSIO 43136]USD64925.1 polysaccharide lyase family 7 protein [Vibrio sp. SCSIO 43136]